jgi:hypothetical protein
MNYMVYGEYTSQEENEEDDDWYFNFSGCVRRINDNRCSVVE